MREILFRGKCNGTEKWLCGGLLSVPEPDRYMILPQRSAPLLYRVDPATVGQFTGLLDKNGKKVFEGDIVESSYDSLYPEDKTIEVIVWYQHGFCIMQPGYFPQPISTELSEFSEVVGNIHDNPELLEVDDE